jgi:hypothetical protein
MKVHVINTVPLIREDGTLPPVNTMDLPVTLKQLTRWLQGEPLKQVFPHLSPEERLFLETGILPEMKEK